MTLHLFLIEEGYSPDEQSLSYCSGSPQIKCFYMYRPGPRTMNQYDPIRITKNMARARANSRYSVSKVAPISTLRRRITFKMAKDIAPVITTVLSIGSRL